MEKTFAILLDKIRLYHPAKDLSRVEKAYQVAKEAHEGQLRQSGEPYLIHPLQVAIILADLELDLETIMLWRTRRFPWKILLRCSEMRSLDLWTA